LKVGHKLLHRRLLSAGEVLGFELLSLERLGDLFEVANQPIRSVLFAVLVHDQDVVVLLLQMYPVGQAVVELLLLDDPLF